MKKDNLLTKINNLIIKLNKPAYIGIILFYAVILIVVSIVLFPKESFVLTPDYPHQIKNQDVNVEIRINPTRRVDNNDDVITNYGIVAYLEGNSINNEKQKYDISNFQMSSLLTTNRMHYFTEHKDSETPISHSYSLYNSANTTKLQIPQEFFVRLKYIDKDDKEQTLTYFENILEIGKKKRYSNYNIIVDEEKHIEKDRKTQVKLDFFGKKESDDFVLRTMIEVVDITVPFHLDMQSWIVTEDGEILHGSGVYGYNGRSYYQTSHLIDLKLNPKYIYSQLNYYEEGKEVQSIYYKDSFTNLPESLNDLPEDPNPSKTSMQLDIVEYLIIIAIGVVIIVFALKVIIDNKNKKKSNNEKNIDKVNK